MKELVVGCLLALALGGALLSTAGVLAFRSVYGRLHFTGPVSMLSPAALALAVALEEGLSPGSLRALLAAFVLAASSPVLTHAAARAASLREQGTWNPLRSRPPRGGPS